MSPDARCFLKYEFSTLALMAGLATRNCNAPVYWPRTSEDDKRRTKDWLRKELGHIVELYRRAPVNEIQHVKNIAAFAEAATQGIGGVLFQGRFRFGVAQKVLNLYLKYHWVTDYVKEPPHCPIDGRIAKKAKLAYQWTISDSRTEYEEAVVVIRSCCANGSIAQWELREFEVGRQ